MNRRSSESSRRAVDTWWGKTIHYGLLGFFGGATIFFIALLIALTISADFRRQLAETHYCAIIGCIEVDE